MLKVIIIIFIAIAFIAYFKESPGGALTVAALGLGIYYVVKHRKGIKETLVNIWHKISDIIDNVKNGNGDALIKVWNLLKPLLWLLLKIIIIIIALMILYAIIKSIRNAFLKVCERRIKNFAYAFLCELGTASRAEFIYLFQFYFYEYLGASMIDKYGQKDMNKYRDNPHTFEELEDEYTDELVNKNLFKCKEEYLKYVRFFDKAFIERGVELKEIDKNTVLYDTGQDGIMSMETTEIQM